MAGLRVLLTTNALGSRGGSEVFVRDLATALVRRGHKPVVYSALLGDTADDLRRATVPVVADLGSLGDKPDVIHGQHHLEAMTAALHFPDVPALYVCHGWLPWEELPPVFPSFRRYVAVDDLCRERLTTTPGVEVERVRTIYNAVNLGRFQARSPLPRRPASALVFSNYAREGLAIEAIRRACAARGIATVDIIGAGAGSASSAPESILGRYDVVFAKARCALEAMAVGCAVIVTDTPGLAGYVTTSNMHAWRRLNFGVRTMQGRVLDEASVGAALDAYDPAVSASVSDWIRADADFDRSVDAYESLYGEVRAEGSPWSASTAAAFTEAASRYLSTLAPQLKARTDAERRASMADAVAAERDQLAASLNGVRTSKAWRAITRYRQMRAKIGI